MKNRYAKVFALIKQINKTGGNVTREELLSEFTGGRTTSLKDLQEYELQEFERSLEKGTVKTKTAKDYEGDMCNNTRRAIIAHFKSIGGTVEQAKQWAEKYGVRGKKKAFNDYDGQELFKLLINAKKVKRDYIRSINKKLVHGI